MNISRTTKSIIFFVLIAAGVLATACAPSAEKLNNEGNDSFAKEAYLEALADYQSAQIQSPELAEPYYNAGNAFQKQGNLESATMQTKQAIRQAEGDLAQNSYYNLGNSYFLTEDWPSAIDAYKEALRLNPDDQDAKYNLELALKNLQQQQQQQQQQNQQQQQGGGGGQQQQQPQQGGGQEQQEQQQNQGGQGEQEQPDGGGGQPEQEQPGQGSQDQGQQAGGSRGLTQQEAEQLLDALGQDSQTLQERLQQGFFAPGVPPGKDW